MDVNGGRNARGSTCIPRYKRRKISARRDFPPGCGHKFSPNNVGNINGSSASLDNKESANGLEVEDESGLDSRDAVLKESPNSKNFELKKCLDGVAAYSLDSNDSFPSVFNFASQLEKPMIKSNILVKNLTRVYPPRRRISAVRHFPLYFERVVPQHTKVESIKAQNSLESSNSRSHVDEDNNLRSESSRALRTHPVSLKIVNLEDECSRSEISSRNADKKVIGFRKMVNLSTTNVCLQDISEGMELIPIRAVNDIDDELPPSFKYITRMVYPDWCRPLPLRGCNCVGGCSDSPDCACAVRNGGNIPFNSNGCIVEMKPLVYECGPSCKCLPSCCNRVSQFGVRSQLEIFKTDTRGWGVRSRSYIPSGSFICEYLGELLEDKQAEQRIDRDEYLFDIRSSFEDAENMEVVYEVAFTIDAKRCGNVGRFINHSCSPNLYAQHVLYDHENRRVAHVMLFAVEDIPPLQEFTYDYNYKIGEVFDVNGNVKIKQCFCGSEECTGRMY